MSSFAHRIEFVRTFDDDEEILDTRSARDLRESAVSQALAEFNEAVEQWSEGSETLDLDGAVTLLPRNFYMLTGTLKCSHESVKDVVDWLQNVVYDDGGMAGWFEVGTGFTQGEALEGFVY